MRSLLLAFVLGLFALPTRAHADVIEDHPILTTSAVIAVVVGVLYLRHQNDASYEEMEKKRAEQENIEKVKAERLEQEERDREAREQYENTINNPRWYLEQSCKIQAAINQLKESSARERRIGERSGFVDANLLHENAQGIDIAEGQLSELAAGYKSHFGQPMPNPHCAE